MHKHILKSLQQAIVNISSTSWQKSLQQLNSKQKNHHKTHKSQPLLPPINQVPKTSMVEYPYHRSHIHIPKIVVNPTKVLSPSIGSTPHEHWAINEIIKEVGQWKTYLKSIVWGSQNSWKIILVGFKLLRRLFEVVVRI